MNETQDKMLKALDESIAHWKRMIEYVGNLPQKRNGEKPNVIAMLNDIHEAWGAEHCPLCQANDPDNDCEQTCPLKSCGIRSPYGSVGLSTTWQEWYCNAITNMLPALEAARKAYVEKMTKLPEPPAGERWCNSMNLTAEQFGIADGWRPLLVSEVKARKNLVLKGILPVISYGDVELRSVDGISWKDRVCSAPLTVKNSCNTYRTKLSFSQFKQLYCCDVIKEELDRINRGEVPYSVLIRLCRMGAEFGYNNGATYNAFLVTRQDVATGLDVVYLVDANSRHVVTSDVLLGLVKTFCWLKELPFDWFAKDKAAT